MASPGAFYQARDGILTHCIRLRCACTGEIAIVAAIRELGATLGGKIDSLGGKIDAVGGKVDALGDKVDTLGTSLGGKMDALRITMLGACQC